MCTYMYTCTRELRNNLIKNYTQRFRQIKKKSIRKLDCQIRTEHKSKRKI